jgi:hypothetical protein
MNIERKKKMNEDTGYHPDRNIVHRPRFQIRLKTPCPECGCMEAIGDTENGEVFCKRCGLVLNKR